MWEWAHQSPCPRGPPFCVCACAYVCVCVCKMGIYSLTRNTTSKCTITSGIKFHTENHGGPRRSRRHGLTKQDGRGLRGASSWEKGF